MQADPSLPKTVLDILITPGGYILGIYLYDRFIARKRNGGLSAEVLAKAVREALEETRKDTTQHLDLAITQNFHWLLRDVEHKVAEEHEKTRKDWTNALQRFMFDLELFVLRGESPKRSRE